MVQFYNYFYSLGVTVALSTAVYFFISYLVNQIMPLILGSSVQIQGLFYIITGLNAFAVIFVLFVVPETAVS